MPNDIIRQANDLISSAVGHGSKTLGIGLVLEGVAGEIYTYIKAIRVEWPRIKGKDRRGMFSGSD